MRVAVEGPESPLFALEIDAEKAREEFCSGMKDLKLEVSLTGLTLMEAPLVGMEIRGWNCPWMNQPSDAVRDFNGFGLPVKLEKIDEFIHSLFLSLRGRT